MNNLQLLDHHLQHLLESAISEEIISSRGYSSYTSFYEWFKMQYGESPPKKISNKNKIPFPILNIPYYRIGTNHAHVHVARPDKPRLSRGKAVKYEYPAGAAPVLDVLPLYHAAVKDANIPLWLTEGAKKADALASAYGNQILPVNENGVWGWRSKGRLIEDLDFIVWEGRKIVLVPDGDVRHNNMVHLAVKRTAKLLLAKGAAEINIMLLPCAEGDKTGVDDYLATGKTIGELESHIVSMESVAQTARIPFMKNPLNRENLFLPSDYDIQNNSVIRRGRGTIYNGIITVTSTGRNLHTGDEWVTVEWNGKGIPNSERISRADLGSGESLRKALASRGAALHARNTGEVSNFLSDLIQENWTVLPRIEYVDSYGMVNEGNGLVLPAGAIGVEREPSYNGQNISIGKDPSIYPHILQEIEGWSSTRILWLIFSMVLASPAITRMGHDRNPVIYLGGQSGTGKTTLANFALGVFGDPRPQTIQCGSGTTTRVGLQQSITRTCGMPVFFEDVHAMLTEREKSRRITGTIYDFANKQGRFIGSLDQKGRGGQVIGGTLLMAGEMLPEFTHAGQTNRTLTIDCSTYPPLGVAAQSGAGAERADLLKQARDGYGIFGYSTYQHIWEHWDTFTNDVERLTQHEYVQDLAAWAPLIATATAALRVAFALADIRLSYDLPIILMRDWAKLIQESRTKREPSEDAFDRIILMLAQSKLERYDDLPTWEFLEFRNTMVAGKLSTERHWRVPTGGLFDDIVGSGIVFQFGRKWLEEGKIKAHSGKEPVSAKCRVGRSLIRAINIPTMYVGDCNEEYSNYAYIEEEVLRG